MAAPTEQLNRLALFRDLGYEPHPGQMEVHKSRKKRRVLACGVRWGKTKAAAMEAVAAALEPKDRSIGWIVAPTYDLADRVFREIQVVTLEKLRHRVITMKEHERRLVLRNMSGGTSEIRAKTADNPVSLLGEGLDFVIVDEAARLKPGIWENHVTQRLIDKQGWALLLSTPKGKNYFYDLFLRGQGRDPDYESWNHPSWNNPYLDRPAIEAERDRLPQRFFDQEFGGQFAEGAGQVFRNIHECATGEFQDLMANTIYVGGLDLAKTEDYTVLAIMSSDRRLVALDRFHRLDWFLQVTRIKATLDRYANAPVITDVTGVGDPIYESLRIAGCNALAYPFTARSKAALINNLALQLELKRITLPRRELCPELIDELESFEFSVTDSGNVRSGAPSGRHDDTVIALALACWPLRPNTRSRTIVEPIGDMPVDMFVRRIGSR